MGSQVKYLAFLSYSHQDAKVCKWLHESLEKYQVPRRLVGRETRDGKVPERLFPVFRDVDELPGSSELGKNLTDALAQSRYLLVVCSPAAARSLWVNEEIRQFKSLNGEGRVLALIVDGEPNASDRPESGLLECFPEALKYRLDSQGNLTGERVEPIAADIREGHGLKSIELLRLIAGLIGVPFDDLRQRERERAKRTLALRLAIGSLAFVVLSGGMLWQYREDRIARLEELGREALMQNQPTQAAVFLAETYGMGNTSEDVRIMLDQAMRSVDMLVSIHGVIGDEYHDSAFSPDSARLVATSLKGNVLMWRSDNGRELLSLPNQNQRSTKLARFVNNGIYLALIGDGSISLVRSSDGLPIRESTVLSQIHPLAPVLQPESGDNLLYADKFGHTLIYDVVQGAVSRELPEPCSLTTISKSVAICLHASSGQIHSTASVYKLHSNLKPKNISLSNRVVSAVIMPDERKAIFALSSGVWQLVDLESGNTIVEATHPGGVDRVRVSANGNLIATGGATGSILLWSSASGHLFTQIQAHVGRILALYFVAEDRQIVSVGEDGSIKVWDTTSGALLTVNQTGHGISASSAISPDGIRLATWPTSTTKVQHKSTLSAVKVWDMPAAGPEINYANASVLPPELLVARRTVRTGSEPSPCRDKLRVQANSDNSLTIIDASSGTSGLNLFAGLDTANATFDCDSTFKWYLTGGKSGAAVLWSATSAKPVARFVGHVGALEDAVFLPHFGEIATFGIDGTVAKWNYSEEDRSAAVISRRVACRVPLRLEGYALLPKEGSTHNCNVGRP
jgi:WD40 repeat protein